ncbi:MAG: DUF6691 family protein, partial [Deltaproteobacteria bacterium]
AVFAGALFGLGLVISGMTDTVKVQAWLDVAGNWDPTLAFVLGGAVLPMMVVWRIAARMKTSFSGTPIPAMPRQTIDAKLVAGSALFGAGWALAGFCPGPALASLSFGGSSGVVFLIAMVIGMIAARFANMPKPARASDQIPASH